MAVFNKAVAEECHELMTLIRCVEETIADNYFPEDRPQEMRCPIHLSIGQEASAVGVVSQLEISAKVFSTHRSHAHYLAKGGSIEKMLGEMLGRSGGCLDGRGGSMHLKDQNVNFMMSVPIVGSVMPLAAGAAFANKVKENQDVVVVFIGDGSLEEGVWHETANFAALNSLKILFVCENNLYSVYSKLDSRQPSRDLARFARAHDMAFFSGDGNAIDEVFSLASQALDVVRSAGPCFLNLNTYRHREHCGPNFDDHLGYRPQAEVDEWFAKDPLKISAKILKKNFNHTNDSLRIILEACSTRANDAFQTALNFPLPKFSNIADLEYPQLRSEGPNS